VRNEGPLGDRTGYYMLPEPSPVFHVAAQLSGSDLSLMPDGMESALAVEPMADLIAFLLPPP
jgi:hypothetical protein